MQPASGAEAGAGAGAGGAWGAWAGWALDRELVPRRRVRVSLHDLPRQDYAALEFYTPDQIRHIIRLQSALGRWPPTAPPVAWRQDRRHADIEPWRIPDIIQNMRLEPAGEAGGAAAAGAGGAAAGRGWQGALRGWAAGALLLAALLLLVRALERCLHRRLFKEQRRSSEEWPTPNVFATSRFGGATPRLDDCDPFPSDNRESSGNDLPPPYSECANNGIVPNVDANKPMATEEPPPPYSACYFSNPKNGMPTVHFYSRRSDNTDPDMGHSSRDSVAAPSATDAEPDKDASGVTCEDRNVRNPNQRCEVRVVCDDINTDMQHASDEPVGARRSEHEAVKVDVPATVVRV